ncbi:TPA: fimbrial protein [Escherichia albertii]|uniref:fimbrial protein n=1 Tax=Escherichia albertii TaxID=208962 RepID=UPI0007436D0E|nr:fimbrial protein [Escherichia albertii]EEU9599667.1 type 1 fimbrial protein [Escherichia albertii]EEX4923824.1 type 1 fimbrial protein [Escherichia albertii]EFO1265968.1 type 1 fimbrial protein [Escherichia albertii]EHQ8142910.1 type 1 fimbrial protein [Escherichia albertii]MCZ8703204.1 fimbrial protein [Escherichia albertii]
MKLTLRRLVTATAILTLPCFALAAPTIQFQGEVTDQTCNVNINGDTNSVVLLPTVKTSDLATNGESTGITPFTITLSNCSGITSTKTVTTNFLGHSVITPSGILGNTATGSAAKNVGIQLLETADADPTAINLSGVTTAASTITLTSGENSGSHIFGARYYATGVASAGKVTAVAEYTVSYN